MKRLIVVISFLFLSAGAFGQVTKQNKWLFSRADGQEILAKLERLANESKSNGNVGLYAYYRLLTAEISQRVGQVVESEQIFSELVQLGSQNRSGKTAFLAGSKLSKTWFDPADELAFLYLNLGNLEKARAMFEQSRVDRAAAFGPRSVHRILPIVGLGAVAFRANDHAKSLQYFDQALTLLARATTTGYDFDNVAQYVYSDAVELYLQENRLKEAGKYLDYLTSAASSKFKYASKGAAQLETARIFELMARYQISLGHDTRAQHYIERGLHFMAESQLKGIVQFKLMRTQGILLWKQGRMDEAASAFIQMAKDYRQYLADNFSSMTEYERERFYHSVKADFEALHAFAWDCHLAGSASRLNLYEAVLESQWEIKGLLLGDLNYTRNYIQNSGDRQLHLKLGQLESMRSKLAALFYQKDTDLERIELQRSIETLEKQINQSIPKRFASDWSWRQVQEQLKSDEMGVELLRIRIPPASQRGQAYNHFNFWSGGSVVYLGLMIRREGPIRAFGIDNGAVIEGRPAKAYRNRMLAQLEDEESYNQFWQPIRGYFSEVKSIYLATDGVYAQINVNTLKNPTTQKYVLDELDINYVTSLRDLGALGTPTSSSSVVLVGRPQYDMQGPTTSASLRSLATETLSTMKEISFGDLPATELEVSSIEQSLQESGLSVEKYIGAEATEERIRSIQKPRVLHLATHGFFIPDTSYTVNPMIRSGLVLAGIKGSRSSSDDGILTAYETSLLDLQGTELVVLSACETGLGETRYGEGVYGLQRAVITAGAQNLLMSLWKVDDQATRELMSFFFQRWSQQRKAGKSFREAQQQLRKSNPHPYYWGAFILLGK